MAVKDILLLGDPRLYQKSEPVLKNEINGLFPQIELLFETVIDFRNQYGCGRAIAVPQIGLMKRVICLNTDKPVAMLNPELSDLSKRNSKSGMIV